MSIKKEHIEIDSRTRIELSICTVSGLTLAAAQGLYSGGWSELGLAGCGNNRRDALNDLSDRLDKISGFARNYSEAAS